MQVSDNGMVTIRSPALQQAINAGLTPPPKPDFIVKGDITSKCGDSSPKSPASMKTPSLSELRSRLTPDCTGLSGLANIQIRKVTSGQSIPENGINLEGTNVTLTKVRTDTETQQPRTCDTNVTAPGGKSKKKKKKGNGQKQTGDDWNLVGEKKT